MAQTKIESNAFRRAVLQSERLRITGLLIVVGIIIAFSLVRAFVSLDQPLRLITLRRTLPIGVGLAVYEFLMLLLVNRSIAAEREPPPWLWRLNVIIEALVPTLIILVMTFSPYPGPYLSLVSPALLAYFIFIVLATLRLRPVLCVLTGLTSVAGYLTAVAVTFRRFPEPSEFNFYVDLGVYLTFSLWLLLGSFAAAAVTRQIRVHVMAALREAEARRQVEQMEHDLDIARSIQQGLLPRKAPQLSGFDIAGWSQPADQTGGDYYDWQELSGGRLVVSLADVTGHGIGPALVTAVCRAYARASFLGEAELGALVDRLHSLLAEDLPPSRFVTFVAAILDEHADRLQLISAGHGPILLYSATDDVVEVRNADGLPLGVMPDIPYAPAQTIAFRPGDILVLITDGFFEWANDRGEQFGIDRLRESIRSNRELPAATMIERIHREVLTFTSGTPQTDDLTAVIVRRAALS